jgi:hypothetical protein
MSLIQIGLVDKTGTLDPEFVQEVAAALNVQVTRDVPQFWNVQATVIYLSNAQKVPSGVWPVQLVKTLPPNEGGFHLDKHNQPYAEVIASANNDAWTIAASHETIEMLVDPAGNRMQSSRSIEIANGGIQDGSSEFGYLVEACDPCEADAFAYNVQGVAVSDFLTPHFYDTSQTTGTRYSFTGAITAPRQVLNGGYISFVNQATGEWQQITNLNNKPQLVTLGAAKGARSLREWVDNHMAASKLTTTVNMTRASTNTRLLEQCRNHRTQLEQIARNRAAMLTREQAHAHGSH